MKVKEVKGLAAVVLALLVGGCATPRISKDPKYYPNIKPYELKVSETTPISTNTVDYPLVKF